MKYCKIEIEKERLPDSTNFIYPAGYDPRDHGVMYYQNEGGTAEFALSTVPDDFDFSPDGFTELNQAQFNALADNVVANDKDFGFDPAVHNNLSAAKAEFKTKRSAYALERKNAAVSTASARTGKKPEVRTK